jgi:hypothetical protein
VTNWPALGREAPVRVSGGQTGVPTPPGSAPQPITPGASGSADEDALWRAIRAEFPGTEFYLSCADYNFTALNPDCFVAGGWSAEQLATGIAGVGAQSSEAGVLYFFTRRADGEWGYWTTIANAGGGPLTRLPGDGIVCADGDGLNLRAEPSTSAPVITLLADETRITADRYVQATAGNRRSTAPEPSFGHGDGWYHVVSPQEGWAYDAYVVPATDGGCGRNWWP